MTLLHITATPERVLLVTDSVAYQHCDDGRPGYDVLYRPDGLPLTWNKPHVLASMSAVLMARGLVAGPGAATYVINALRGLCDFDQAVERLVDVMPAAPGAFASGEWGSEFHLIGWSKASGQVRVVRFDSEDGYSCAMRGASGGNDWYMFSPEPPGLERRALPQSVSAAASLARDAISAARAVDPQVPFGGRLLVCEVTRGRIVLEDAGEIGLPPRRPNARDVLDLRTGVSHAPTGSAL